MHAFFTHRGFSLTPQVAFPSMSRSLIDVSRVSSSCELTLAPYLGGSALRLSRCLFTHSFRHNDFGYDALSEQAYVLTTELASLARCSLPRSSGETSYEREIRSCPLLNYLPLCNQGLVTRYDCSSISDLSSPTVIYYVSTEQLFYRRKCSFHE